MVNEVYFYAQISIFMIFMRLFNNNVFGIQQNFTPLISFKNMMSEMQDLPDGQLPAIEPEEPRLPPPTQIQFTLPSPNLNDSNIMINHFTHQQQNKPYFQEHSLTGIAQHEQNTAANEAPPQIEPQALRQQDNLRLQNNANQQQSNPVLKMALILSIAGVLLLGTTGTYVGLRQANKDQNNSDGISDDQINNNNNNNNDYDQDQDNTNNSNKNNSTHPTFEQMCSQQSYLCNNLSEPIKNYTFQSVSQIDHVMSFLQLSQSFSLIEKSITSNLSRRDFLQMANNVTLSIQCLMYYFPGNFSQIYEKILEIQIDNQKELQKYLNMTSAFNDEIYEVKRQNQLVQSCGFVRYNKKVTQMSPQVKEQSSTNCWISQFLLYFTGYGISPLGVVKNLHKLNSSLGFNANSRFKKIIAIGAFKNLDYGKSLLDIYKLAKYDAQRGSNITIQEIKLIRAFLRLINAFYSLEDLPEISSEIFGIMQIRLEKQLAISFNQQSQLQYQMQRDVQLVTQLIREGRKVIMFAHGYGAIHAYNVYIQVPTVDSYGLINNQNPRYYYEALKVVFVGPLSDRLPCGGSNNCYVSIENDGVIIALQRSTSYIYGQGIPTPLYTNTYGKRFNDVSMNHSLVGYLQNYRDKIASYVISARLTAKNTNPQYESGLLSIQLTLVPATSSNMPNLNLHIFEPNSSHVYYKTNSSANGQLSNQKSRIPPLEHYQTRCNLTEGNYTVKVNLFDNSLFASSYSYSSYTQITFCLSVVAAQNIFTTLVKLQNFTYAGQSGNQNPKYTICTVNVRKNTTTGQFITQIYNTFSVQ